MSSLVDEEAPKLPKAALEERDEHGHVEGRTMRQPRMVQFDKPRISRLECRDGDWAAAERRMRSLAKRGFSGSLFRRR